MLLILLLIRLCLLLFFSFLGMAATAAETVRETRTVTVGGTQEEWTLKWSGPVKPVCAATDLAQAATCPCAGYAYGEQGQLVLERQRGGVFAERLNLSTLFDGYDNPADTGNAALPLLPRYRTDPFTDASRTDAFQAGLASRPRVDAMQLQDYARDGMKATFLLQVGNVPCGKLEMALVGVSSAVPHLHTFTTTAHPERPLVLQASAWKALLATDREVKFTDLTCGDHASEQEREQIISAHAGTFAVQSDTYACNNDGSRGRLLSSEQQ